MNILLAEDDEVLADGVSRFLRHTGHSVDLVQDGAAAIAALARDDLDLLVLDFGLPKVHGSEVLRQLRVLHPRLPVLLVSACDDAEVRVRELGMSVDAFLPKPFSLDALETSIQRFRGDGGGAGASEIEHDPVGGESGRGSDRSREADSGMPPHLRALLQLLSQRNGGLVGHREIAERLSEWTTEEGPNAVANCVTALSARLGVRGDARIVAVRGLGWRLVDFRTRLVSQP